MDRSDEADGEKWGVLMTSELNEVMRGACEKMRSSKLSGLSSADEPQLPLLQLLLLP